MYTTSEGKPSAYDAVTPSYSPDNRVVLAGVGPRVADSVFVHTLDPSLGTKPAIANYAEPRFAARGEGLDFPIPGPILSPDGTRLELSSDQVWAARRNMSLPPKITQVGAQTVADTTPVVSINAVQGAPTTVQVLATDPEGDPITCGAFFLQDGMTFDSTTCTLSWTPSAPLGTKFYVKFRVATVTWPKASGGTDAIIAQFTVVSSLGPGLSQRVEPIAPQGPNPTRGGLILSVPAGRGDRLTATVYDLAGRRVATVRGVEGRPLVWDGRAAGGSPAGPGVYLYRVETEAGRYEGKLVILR